MNYKNLLNYNFKEKLSEIIQKACDLLLTKRCICCNEIIDTFSMNVMCEDCKDGCKNKDIHDHFYKGDKITAITAVFIYDGPIRRGLCLFKYNNKVETGIYMAKRIADMIKLRKEYNEVECIISVPCFNLKKAREYNQSEFLAKRVARRLSLPFEPGVLKKTIDRKSQTKCKTAEERYENVQNIYRVALPEAVKNKTILIIDDIFTTGYTLETCAGILIKAGAKQVLCAVAAKTPYMKINKNTVIKKSLVEEMKIIQTKGFIKVKNSENMEAIYQKQKILRKIKKLINRVY
jgi:ComF family protein